MKRITKINELVLRDFNVFFSMKSFVMLHVRDSMESLNHRLLQYMEEHYKSVLSLFWADIPLSSLYTDQHLPGFSSLVTVL